MQRQLTEVALAGAALATAADLRSNTDALADLELLDSLADFDDLADDFVARHDKLGRKRSPATRDGVVVLIVSNHTLRHLVRPPHRAAVVGQKEGP
jgi:hypothetical protein